MPSSCWWWAAASLGLLGASLFVHTRLVGFLPEDPPVLARKRHAGPVPMVGLLPAVLTVLACAVAGRYLLALGVVCAAAAGLVDDARKAEGGVDWRVKSLALLTAALCATLDLQDARAPDADPGTLVLVCVLVFCLTNALNFLDNTDGVALALGVSALWLAAGGAGLGACLALLWLCVLPFNWPRGHVFLGDCGAYALGLCAATIAVSAGLRSRLDVVEAIAPLTLPAADFVQVVAARLWLGFAPWIGDRRHLSHIASNLGLPAVLVAPVFVAITIAAYRVLTDA